MIDLVNSPTIEAVRLRNETFSLACVISELIHTDKPTYKYKYFAWIQNFITKTSGYSEERYLSICRGFTSRQLDISRNIANHGLDPTVRMPIRLVCPGKTIRIVDGNRRFATLLALGRPALAAYPHEYEGDT